MTKTLRPYQLEDIAFATKAANPNVLIADEPGLGKTLSAIEAIRPTTPLSEWSWRILVVCPQKTIGQWVAEIREAYPNDPIHVSGSDSFFLNRDGWTITYFEAVRTWMKRRGKLKAKERKALSWWDGIIVDEAHRIANRRALQSIAVKCWPTAHKIALTGTPMEKSPAELWSLFNWLDPKKFTSYWAWYRTFVEVAHTPFGDIIKGTQDPERLAQVIAPYMIRHTKKEVAPELPPRIIVPTFIQMDQAQQELYDMVCKAADILIDVGLDRDPILLANELSRIVYLQRITSLPESVNFDIASAKVDWVLEWVTDHPNEQVVVFSKFRATAEYLHARIPSSSLLEGGVEAVPAAWLNGETQVLSGTIASMSEGLNLQQASTAIFVDSEWSSIKMTQALDRIHRMDITEPKVIYLLQCVGTVDELVVDAFQNKQTEIELVHAAVRHLHERRGDA